MNYSFLWKISSHFCFLSKKGGSSPISLCWERSPRVANNNNSENINNHPRERWLTVGLWIYEWIFSGERGSSPYCALCHKGKQPTLMGSIRREKLSKQYTVFSISSICCDKLVPHWVKNKNTKKEKFLLRRTSSSSNWSFHQGISTSTDPKKKQKERQKLPPKWIIQQFTIHWGALLLLRHTT